MHPSPRFALLAVGIAVCGSAAGAADAFAPAGTKATLTVDYRYESAGKQRSEGQYDPYEWKVRRNAQLVAQLSAGAPKPLPAVHTIETAQIENMKSKAAKAEAIGTRMAPSMDAAMKIAEKCGDNDACMEREAMKLGAEMRGNGQMAALQGHAKALDEVTRPGAPRYQAWNGVSQSGSYDIDEVVHISVTDPICIGRPRNRCIRDETRKGAGKLPVAIPGLKVNGPANASTAAVEIDTQKNTLAVRLPGVGLLPLTETITSDEPEGTHETPTPKGPHQILLTYRLKQDRGADDEALVFPLKGGWRSQSGEQVLALKGPFGDTGKLTVRWQFVVP